MSVQQVFHVPTDAATRLSRDPEHGMGWQRVLYSSRELRAREQIGTLIDGTLLVPLDVSEGSYLSNSFRLKHLREVPTIFDVEVKLLSDSDNASVRMTTGNSSVVSQGPGNPISPNSSIQHHYSSVKGSNQNFFVRFATTNRSPRLSTDGTVTPGTFAVPILDAQYAVTGLAAKARYALPTVVMPEWIWLLELPPGATAVVQTVTPKYLESGGGVEAILTGARLVAALSIASTLRGIGLNPITWVDEVFSPHYTNPSRIRGF
jgi:hypothetical protein